jgi:ribose-phosphate pyrophosphokinase
MQARAPLLCALHESQALALAIGRESGLDGVPIEERPFEEGEFKLRPLASVRERTVYVVHSLAGSADAPVAQRLIRLLFLLFGLHDAGAERVVAVLPYLSFARKDRRTQPRDPVNTRYIAQLLESTGLNRLLALDVHNPAAFDNAFRIPTDHLSATPMFVEHFAQQCADAPLTVASPDVGGIKRAQIFRELLERRLGRPIELAFIEKRRTGGELSGGRVVGQVAGRELIVLDDLCASGATLTRAASSLSAAGARAVHVAFTHAPLARGLDALLACEQITQIVLTDSVGSALAAGSPAASARVHVLPVAPLLAAALGRLLAGAALTPLLHSWPPPAYL